MESKHSAHTLPPQQQLDDWDYGLLRLIPSNSVSPVAKSPCEAYIPASISGVQELTDAEPSSNTDPFGSTEEDFLWTDFSFLDTILAIPDPMRLDSPTNISGDDPAQAEQLANILNGSSVVSSAPTMTILPVSRWVSAQSSLISVVV